MSVKVWIEHIILKFIENFSQISKLQNPENNRYLDIRIEFTENEESTIMIT